MSIHAQIPKMSNFSPIKVFRTSDVDTFSWKVDNAVNGWNVLLFHSICFVAFWRAIDNLFMRILPMLKLLSAVKAGKNVMLCLVNALTGMRAENLIGVSGFMSPSFKRFTANNTINFDHLFYPFKEVIYIIIAERRTVVNCFMQNGTLLDATVLEKDGTPG